MNSFDQLPVIRDKQEPKCACVLLLDTSGSMSGDPINELNRGLKIFATELGNDSLASKRIEIAIVTFGPVSIASDFVSGRDFRPPTLETTGATPMSEALIFTADLIAKRKETYKVQGVKYYRPLVFMITDGAPTDPEKWNEAVERIQNEESDKRLMLFPIGVAGADFNRLKDLKVRSPLKLKGLMFKEFFTWVYRSVSSVSQSAPTDTINLSDPTKDDAESGMSGWATIPQ